MDVSGQQATQGVKTTEIFAGKFKRIASQYAPLSKEGRATMQQQVDYTYSLFVQAVATHRGVSVDTVLQDMADGQIFLGQQAIDAGLVDGASTLDALIASLNNSRATGAVVSTRRAGVAAQTNQGKPTMTTGTVKLQRVLRAPPERVYRAFLEADALAKWLPPYGFTCKVHHLEPTVGGSFRMSFSNFGSGSSHAFGGDYLELVPDARIRYTDKFEDPNLPGEMQVTVDLRRVLCGTEIHIMQEGIPQAIPTEMCYLGWQESLAQLANLVEPKIPD
jgi:uncharacterized protein YndB with AHSA1/START domain